jgi:hypothetical protein
MDTVLLFTGSIGIFAWGVAHIIPTPAIVRGFGPLSPDNRRIITMEWVAEGLALCFIGVLVFTAAARFGSDSQTAVFVGRFGAGMLLAMALLSALTGARTSILPMRLCPFVKSLAAVLFLIATL